MLILPGLLLARLVRLRQPIRSTLNRDPPENDDEREEIGDRRDDRLAVLLGAGAMLPGSVPANAANLRALRGTVSAGTMPRSSSVDLKEPVLSSYSALRNPPQPPAAT
jgi:hypothetical protein